MFNISAIGIPYQFLAANPQVFALNFFVLPTQEVEAAIFDCVLFNGFFPGKFRLHSEFQIFGQDLYHSHK